jgi:hypothetical protein
MNRRGQFSLKTGIRLTASAGRGAQKSKMADHTKRHLSAGQADALALPPLVHTRKRGLR